MTTSTLEFINAIANVATAIGIAFTAGQLWISRRQHVSNTEVHVVQLHTHFQQQIRDLQKVFPPDVNSPNWMPQPGVELRAVQLYWYLVFDEWYTCKYLSQERRLNDLWTRYRYGVQSALKLRAFDMVVTNMLQTDAIFFGLARQFSHEIDGLRPPQNSQSSVGAV